MISRTAMQIHKWPLKRSRHDHNLPGEVRDIQHASNVSDIFQHTGDVTTPSGLTSATNIDFRNATMPNHGLEVLGYPPRPNADGHT